MALVASYREHLVTLHRRYLGTL